MGCFWDPKFPDAMGLCFFSWDGCRTKKPPLILIIKMERLSNSGSFSFLTISLRRYRVIRNVHFYDESEKRPGSFLYR